MGIDHWTKIGEIAEVFDGPHATPKKIDEGPYFLSISSLENGKLDLSKSARLSEEQFVKWTKRVTPQGGDVLFSYETRLGEAALMPTGVKACLGRRMGLLRPDIEKVFPQYLLYAYLGPNFQMEIRTRTINGATVDRIALKELPEFSIKIPPLPEQKAIAHVLGTLDDRIELNRRMNETLEGMAQALFKSWFVDFDPVLDNALASGKEIPEELQDQAKARQALGESKKSLPPEIRTLFPDQFTYTDDLGWIPEGWEVGCLEDMVTLQRGFDLPKKKRTRGSFPLIAASGQDGTHNESKVSGPGVVTGRSGKLGGVSFVQENFWPLNTTLWVKKYNNSNPYHAYQLLKTLELERYNSGSAVPTLNRNHVHGMRLLVPPMPIIMDFSHHSAGMLDKLHKNQSDANTLSNLRDTLLPKLLSGELRIPDAEIMVEELA